jgi:hypothetical protein
VPYSDKNRNAVSKLKSPGYYLEFKNRHQAFYPMGIEFIGNGKLKSNAFNLTGILKVSIPQRKNVLTFSINNGIVIDKYLKDNPYNSDTLSCDWEDLIYCFYDNVSIQTSIVESFCIPDWSLCIGERIADCYNPGC